MDPVMAKLNEAIQQKIGQGAGIGVSGAQPRQEPLEIGGGTFNQTLANKMLEKVQGESLSTSELFSGVSAEGITIRDKNVEAGIRSGEFGEEPLGEKFFASFREMNRDLVGLDATIEVLSMDNLKLTFPQALSIQAGMTNAMVYTEAFSRFVDVVGRSIQTITSTQV